MALLWLRATLTMEEPKVVSSHSTLEEFTSYQNEEDIYCAVRAGALGFILKDAATRHCLNASGKFIGRTETINVAVKRGLVRLDMAAIA